MNFFDAHLLDIVIFLPLVFAGLVALLPASEAAQIRADYEVWRTTMREIESEAPATRGGGGGAAAMSGFRLGQGGRIDRSRPVAFTFDGKRYTGFAGDSLASALLASLGIVVVTVDPAGSDRADVVAVNDVDGHYANWFVDIDASAALVRPDFYVFGSASDASSVDKLAKAFISEVTGK